MTATPIPGRNGSYGTPASIALTLLLGNGTVTNFYVIRHANFTSLENTEYTITVPTSQGNVTIPQLGGTLSLHGRDSKFHVTDYDLDGIKLIYSSAEIFTWARGAGSTRVLVLYGGAGETHELALSRHLGNPTIVQGSDIDIRQIGATWVIKWKIKPDRCIVRLGDLEIYLLWRNEAYSYWPMELQAPEPIGNFTSPSKDLFIIKAGYLIRTAKINKQQLWITGDINATTQIEVISSPTRVTEIVFNGKRIQTSKGATGKISGVIDYQPPALDIPDISKSQWKYLDSLPEIKPSYDDSAWISCSKNTTNNPLSLKTPTSLYALDYGFHAGSIFYRGHFVANGHESYLMLNVSGGWGFGHSVWLNDTFISSWVGSSNNSSALQELPIPDTLSVGQPYTLSVLIDNMGQDEEAPGTDAVKLPNGILNYQLSGHDQSDVSWKITGNLGGEKYQDHARGPLNEGSMYAERQGYHYPGPPDSKWENSSPVYNGISQAGVGFYTTSFHLDIPDGWDVPMTIVFNQSSSTKVIGSTGTNYRCQLFLNGYQFGKYSMFCFTHTTAGQANNQKVNNLGPQVSYPVPEGILNHNGLNYIALTLWALDFSGAKLGNIALVPSSVIRSGYTKPQLAPQPVWTARPGAY